MYDALPNDERNAMLQTGKNKSSKGKEAVTDPLYANAKDSTTFQDSRRCEVCCLAVLMPLSLTWMVRLESQARKLIGSRNLSTLKPLPRYSLSVPHRMRLTHLFYFTNAGKRETGEEGNQS